MKLNWKNWSNSDQQDGLRYPAFYRVQDNQAAKGLWLGASNFYDPVVNKNYDKSVHARGI